MPDPVVTKMSLFFFNRADRPPSMGDGVEAAPDPYPVVLAGDPGGWPRRSLTSARGRGGIGTNSSRWSRQPRLVAFSYQAVVHLLVPRGRNREVCYGAGRLHGGYRHGFVENYFPADCPPGLPHRRGRRIEMSLKIVNPGGPASLPATTWAARADVVRERRFPLMFFNPDLLAALPPPRPVGPVLDGSRGAGTRRARWTTSHKVPGRTLLFISVGRRDHGHWTCCFTARAVRAAAVLAGDAIRFRLHRGPMNI